MAGNLIRNKADGYVQITGALYEIWKQNNPFRRNIFLLVFSTIIYFIGFISGCFLLYFFHSNIPSLEVFSSLENTLIFEDSSTTLVILQNNANIILFLISGSFLAGLTTFMNLIFNGYFFGLFLMGCTQSGMQITTILILTLPHVIFELPAIWIAGAAGFKIPYELIRYFLGKKEHILNKQEINDFLMLAVTAFILIVIAAFVEASITMKIADVI